MKAQTRARVAARCCRLMSFSHTGRTGDVFVTAASQPHTGWLREPWPAPAALRWEAKARGAQRPYPSSSFPTAQQ